MGGVLVIGEALVDVVVRADGSTTEHPGGSPLNVAIGLARLGRQTHLLTRLGDDERGRSVLEHLQSSGVHLVPGSVGAHATSTAVAALAPDGSASYAFDLVWDLGAAALPEDPVAVHTGSIGAALEPGATRVEQLLLDHRHRATTTFDPNLRPDLMGSPSAVRDRVERLVAASDVVKFSDEDAAWLAPDEAPHDLVARWLRAGPAVVALTRGGQGMFALCRAGSVDVPAPRVQVADTVGAGDSAMAALVDGLWEHGLLGAPARQALVGIGTDVLDAVVRRAVRAAAITVSRPGADPPRRDELG